MSHIKCDNCRTIETETAMTRKLPDLSRFELQCLRLLWTRGEATVRDVHGDLADPPSYSTVRKIFERLEEKGAVRRAGRSAQAWRYRPAVNKSAMMRKEIGSLLETLFDGSAGPLVSHLADMDALTLEDLRALEERLAAQREEDA
jgi:predicted transcriptional regulator